MSEPDIEAMVASLVDAASPEQSALQLSLLINRAVARLHTLARSQAAVVDG